MADPTLKIALTDGSGTPEPFLTLPGGIGLYRRRTEISLAVTETQGLSADIKFRGCFFQLGANGDSFLITLIPGAQDTNEFDLGIHWDANGVTFIGGAMLDLTIPVTAKTGLIDLKGLHIIIRPEFTGGARVPVEISADLAGSLGPIAVVLERIGIIAEFFLTDPNRGISLGPVSATVGFKPPTGGGLSLEIAGVVKGGGLISYDSAKGRYAGIFSVNLFGFGVTANVIINTKPKFSLLVILTADFRPIGLDISFGFTINAVGGLLGLNRGVDSNALRDGIRNNAVSSLMFPANPIEDGPRIINDLERIFPPVDKQFLVGPMIELGWGKPTGMLTLALGVIIQVPNPNIIIVGIFRVLVPPMEQALLRIQVNFAGGVQFDKQMLWLEGSLYDSRLVMYSLEGDMAARLRWGSNPSFAVTVGGFNPRYTPAAELEIPTLRRIAINLLPTSDNPRIRLESYYAVTSNTLQHGARVEAYAEALGFSLRGFLEYHILAQISPLYIDATFEARVGIFFDDEEIMGLQLHLHVTGPSPWHVDGEVSFKFIIKRITIPVRATFGTAQAPALPDIDVATRFTQQIENVRNWKAVLPDESQLMVQLSREFKVPPEKVVAHPAATIEFNQLVVPLKVAIQRFGAAKPVGANFFELSGMLPTDLSGAPVGDPFVTEQLQSEFAPAQYFNLSSDDLLSAPAFRRMESGIRANGAALVKFGKPEPRVFKYREDIIDPLALDGPLSKFAREKIATTLVLAGLAGSAVARSDLYQDRITKLPTGDEIKVSQGTWHVVDKTTLTTVMVEVHNNPIAASQALGKLVALDPAQAGKLMVIADYEMV